MKFLHRPLALLLATTAFFSASAGEKPGQILIEARFIATPIKAADNLLLPANLLAGKIHSAILTATEAARLLKEFETQAGTDILSTPRVTTLSGRQAKVAVLHRQTILSLGEVETGVTLDLLPTVAQGGIELTAMAKLTEFNGYEKTAKPKPVFLVRGSETKVTLADGGYLLIALQPMDVPAGAAAAKPQDHLFCLVTARFAAPDGSLLKGSPLK